MCGLICAWGPNSASIVANGLVKMQHRGPDGASSYQFGELNLGFVRLSINDHSGTAMQPINCGDLWGAFNCEIYNYEHLRTEHEISQAVGSDAAVILPLFAKNPFKILNQLRGFFSGVIYDAKNKKLYTLRDAIGQKPLFLARSGRTYILTSELKSCPELDAFEEVPLGLCQISLQGGEFRPLAVSLPSPACPADGSLADILFQSVNMRTRSQDDSAFGVFLSGGLDSSIIAALVNKSDAKENARYYFFDDATSQDTVYAKEVLSFLEISNCQLRPVSLPSPSEVKELIDNVVYHTESYNPSIISNGLGSYILSRAAHRDGLKFALGGDGADEVFCGYFDFKRHEDWMGSRDRLLRDLPRTEMRRVDMASMANSIEVRSPYLDAAVIRFADSLQFQDFYDIKEKPPIRKLVLRETFKDILPVSVTWRRKLSFDLGSGLQRLVYNICAASGHTETQHLKSIWWDHFHATLGKLGEDSYFHSYSAFDKYIGRRGEKFGGTAGHQSREIKC